MSPCFQMSLPGGGSGIICTGRQRQRRCWCGQPGVKLCDWPIELTMKGKKKTCDKACCVKHSVHVGEDRDYCLDHALQQQGV